MNQKEAYSCNFYFKWVQTVNEINFFSFKEGEQIVCHIPNIKIFTTKTGLLKTIRDYEDLNTNTKEQKYSETFLLPSFRLDILTDEINFLEFPEEDYWIYKPYGNNQGKGIKLMKNIRLFKENLVKSKKFYLSEYNMNKFLCESDKKNIMASTLETDNEEENSIDTNSIMQKYLEKPLLINKKKFDIRCYALIASTKPLFVLFHHGYLRFAIDDYSLSIFEQPNGKFVHLTNNSIQKKHPEYSKVKEETIWTMEMFEEFLIKEKKIDKKLIDETYQEIKKIIAYVIKTGKEKLVKKNGFYELIGCDFLLDENLKPYLLEMNTNPAIFTDLKVHKNVIPDLINKVNYLFLFHLIS